MANGMRRAELEKFYEREFFMDFRRVCGFVKIQENYWKIENNTWITLIFIESKIIKFMKKKFVLIS